MGTFAWVREDVQDIARAAAGGVAPMKIVAQNGCKGSAKSSPRVAKVTRAKVRSEQTLWRKRHAEACRATVCTGRISRSRQSARQATVAQSSAEVEVLSDERQAVCCDVGDGPSTHTGQIRVD